MPVAVVMDFKDGTLEQYDQVIAKLGFEPGGAGAPGGLFHWVTATDDGIRVTDVWETAEQYERFGAERLGPITQEVGVPGPPVVSVMPVHNYLTAGYEPSGSAIATPTRASSRRGRGLRHRAQRRVQRDEALASLAVGLDPVRHGLDDRRPGARTRATASWTSAKTPAATPPSSAAPNDAPSSTAVRWSGSSSTEARIRSHRPLRAPPPDTRPERRAAGHLADEVQAVAQAERDALEHRSHERAAVVAQRQPAERAARAGVGVRGALAGEVGQERQPLDARLPRGGVGRRATRSPSRARTCRAASCSEPAADSMTPMLCQAPGTAWQKACTRAARSAAKASEAREHDARGAEHDRRDRGRDRSTPTPSAPAAWSPAPAATGTPPAACPLTARRLERRRQPRRVDLERGDDGVAPAPARDVEQQRPRRVGDVGRVLAAEAQADVVLRQQDVRDARVDVGLVAAQPQQLRRGEARQRAVAGLRDELVEADASARSPRTRPPCAGRSRGSRGAAPGRARRARRGRASAR